MIIPDTEGHIDGHPVLTHTYSMYRITDGHPFTRREIDNKKSKLHLAENKDEDYLGYISFDVPGKVFTYIPADYNTLNRTEVEEVIEEITDYRDDPKRWNF